MSPIRLVAIAYVRRRHATLLAALALLLSLGGNAAAALIITSNSQIARDTISGHHPPSGDHANVIAGSLNGVDILDNSLTGTDVNESTLGGVARRLYFSATAGASARTMMTIGGYAIAAECADQGDVENALVLQVAGPAGAFDYWQATVEAQTNPWAESGQQLQTGGGLITANTWTNIAGHDQAGTSIAYGDYDEYGRGVGTVMLRSGSTVVEIDFEGSASGPSRGNSCWFEGSATRLV